MDKILQAAPDLYQMKIDSSHPNLEHGALLFYPKGSDGRDLSDVRKIRLELSQLKELSGFLLNWLDDHDRRITTDRRKNG